MKKVLDLTNRYIIVATPLLLFLFVLSIYFMAIAANGKVLLILFGFILTFFMLVAFTSGWGAMIKSAVNENSYDEPYKIIKDFTPGVGEYFLPVLGLMALLFLINTIFYTAACFAGMHFIGDTGVAPEMFAKAMANPEALRAFLSSLSVEQLAKLNMWNILILSAISINYYFLMFCFPSLFLEVKNPLKAVYYSIKNLFGKKFLSNIGVYLMIFGFNFIISILSAILANNVILSFVMTLVKFYFICCVVIGVFWYYNKNFVISHLGNSIDTYI